MAPLTPRQIAVRAQEAASELCASLDRAALVQKFLRSYVSEQKRPGRISEPQRYRDLVETIRREALLVLALQVESQALHVVGLRPARRASPAQSRLANLFRGEFLIGLGRSLNYDHEEFDNFCRDLELFRKLYADVPRVSKRSRAVAPPKGPFVDRCGLLLDAPMLDQARRASAKFETQLVTTASAVLKKVFSRRKRR
ncbi:MAG TPA: hypothetical protein VMV59_07765 [Candidatus Dormibacteraeota bacterium]|nr:hypothetical protein [Candidatus Dormibacteraeota bacterium]